MSWASTYGGLLARSVARICQSPAGLPSNKAPIENSRGRVPGCSRSKFHTSAGETVSAWATTAPRDSGRGAMELVKISADSCIWVTSRLLLPNKGVQKFQMEESCSCFAPSTGTRDRFPFRPDRFPHQAAFALRESDPNALLDRGPLRP